MDETTPEVLALRREVERLRESERAAQVLQVELAAKVRALEAFARRASLLAGVTTAMARASTVQEVADAVTRHGHELFGASASLLFLLDEDDGRGRTLLLTSSAGAPPEHAGNYLRIPLDLDLPLTHAVRSGEAVWLEGHADVVRAFAAAAAMRRGDARLEGVVALPLRTTHSIVGGLAFSFYQAVPTFDSVTRDFFLTVCNQCGLAVERAFSFEAERRAREAQQQQQERLAVLAQAAEAARAELHALFMEAPAGICILRGAEHRFELANAPYLALAARTDVVGKTIREVFPELEHQGVYELLDRVYHTGATFHAAEMQLFIDAGDGRGPEERIYNFIYQSIRDIDGAASGVAVFAFEVTAPVRARRRVEALAESLAQTNRALDQFAYITSHDLKAPLRAIGSLAEWLEEDLGPAMTEDARKKMALLRGRVCRMEALIQGILDFSRAGRLPTSRETVDVGRLVTEIVEMLGVRPPATVVLEGDLPTLTTERIALEQVFTNLLGNALAHAGRPDVRVQVEARDTGESWEFFVRDDGRGIAPAFHERIWGIFQTLEARDKVENTGIGLAIVKKIVEGRGGRARVESALGQGACFSFTWPKRESLTD